MKHVGPNNPALIYRISPGDFGEEVNWGNDWVVWCNRNCEGKFAHNCVTDPFKTFFLFEHKSDAVRFRLIWG